MNGTGLHVNYAVETNVNAGAGRAFISSTWDGRTHHSTAKIYPGQSWRYDYNVNMNNGNKVCGSIEGLHVSCVYITP